MSGLTRIQQRALDAIEDGARSHIIAQRADMPPRRTQAALKALERKGLIERQRQRSWAASIFWVKAGGEV